MRLLPYVVLVMLTACDGPDPIDTGDTDDDDFVFDSDSGEEALSELRGVVKLPSGEPAVDTQVDLCLSVCRSAFTDAAGAYTVGGSPGETHALHVHGAAGAAQMLVPLLVTDDVATPQTVDVQLLSLGAAQALPAETGAVAVAPGLTVSLKQGDLSIPLVTDPINAVAGVRAPLDNGLPMGISDTVLAVWYLDPYEAEQSGGTPVVFANDFALAPGATATVRTASYYDFGWIDEGTVTVSEDGLTLSSEGVTLSSFTTVVLSSSPASK